MATGTGQRQGGTEETTTETGDPPAVTVHDAAGATRALSLAGPRGILLLSTPGAAGSLGAAWFRAIVDAAGAAWPEVPHIAVLDCADAPGLALAALRAGLPELILDPGCPAFDQVAATAAAAGARLRTARPPSLDLGPLDLNRAGARAKLAAWLSGSG